MILQKKALDTFAARDTIKRPRKFTQRYRESMVKSTSSQFDKVAIDKVSVQQEFQTWYRALSNGGCLLGKVDIEGMELKVVSKLLQCFPKKMNFELRLVMEYSHDIFPDLERFRTFVRTLRSYGVRNLRYNKMLYNSTRKRFRARCVNACCMIRFTKGPKQHRKWKKSSRKGTYVDS